MVKVGEFGIIHRSLPIPGQPPTAKSMDDLYPLLKVLVGSHQTARKIPNTLYFSSSSQEEAGLRGARTSCFYDQSRPRDCH